MYKKILVPLDGSKLAEQVLPYARSLAGAYGAAVTLLRVSDPDARLPFSASQSASDYLNYTAASLQPLSVESLEKIGKPAEVIVDSAAAGSDCLIAMATHGVTGPRRWFLGSVASKVVQSAANPILLIRPMEEGLPPATITLKRVVVPLDGSGLAEKVLPHVASLARKLKLEVQLVRAYALPPDAYLVADGVIDQGPAQFRRSMHEECEKYLDGKVAGLRADGVDPVTATVIEGDAANEIVELAAGSPQSLIAMSTHGRSGVGRWVLGSVAERVVQYSRAPVLLIRASG
ncbi:MAG: universal stress protein [Candidatus Binatia bacterium]